MTDTAKSALLLPMDVCSESVTRTVSSKSDVSQHDIVGASLPRGLAIVRGLVSAKFSVRVLARLAEAEQKTELAIEQQDYRIAWLTVLRADEGDAQPWRTAFWQIVGQVPEIAIPFWQCRDDLAHDEHVPLHMLPLKFTKQWGSDYIAAKMAADSARKAALPPKKPVEFDLLNFPDPQKIAEARRVRRQKGSTWEWPVAFALCCVVIFAVAISRPARHTYFYQYPNNYLRVVKNLDSCQADGSCGYRFVVQSVTNGVAGPETEMHFCRSLQPRFEQGHTLSWIRYTNIGGCSAIDGYDVVRANGVATLAPNCKADFTQAKDAGHITCEGGIAKF